MSPGRRGRADPGGPGPPAVRGARPALCPPCGPAATGSSGRVARAPRAKEAPGPLGRSFRGRAPPTARLTPVCPPGSIGAARAIDPPAARNVRTGARANATLPAARGHRAGLPAPQAPRVRPRQRGGGTRAPPNALRQDVYRGGIMPATRAGPGGRRPPPAHGGMRGAGAPGPCGRLRCAGRPDRPAQAPAAQGRACLGGLGGAPGAAAGPGIEGKPGPGGMGRGVRDTPWSAKCLQPGPGGMGRGLDPFRALPLG